VYLTDSAVYRVSTKYPKKVKKTVKGKMVQMVEKLDEKLDVL